MPIASFGSTAFIIAKNLKQLKNLKFPTPASIAGAVAVDIGIHATRLAYQFNVATETSQDRAEMLAWRLLDLRKKYDYLRVVGHSLGCRHIVEACTLMDKGDR
jgi:F420-0:gamma-glutamyl ligase-like protein